jgi:MoxR-like ATPase
MAQEGYEPLDVTNPAQLTQAAQRFRDDFAATKAQVARAVVGQTDIVDQTLICLFTGGHVLLEGVPGIGKTLLVRTIARAVSLTFGRVQFTPDLMPADITGTTVVAERDSGDGRKERSFAFQSGPIFAQIVLADEINRATPKTQSALLEAMQERSVTVSGVSHQLPDPFMVLATQNPVEQEGTYPLPEAQLDRFFFKLLSHSPTRADMTEIINRTTGSVESQVQPAIDGPRLRAHQKLVRLVAVAPSVQDYAVRMVLATHPAREGESKSESFSTPQVDKFVRLGASPRAAQTLILAAKCRALLDGRSAVGTDDIRSVALPALRHRLILNFEGHAQGVSADSIISSLVLTLPREAP